MKQIIILFLILTFYGIIIYAVGYRKGYNKGVKTQSDEAYIEEYMNDHKEYIKGE